MMMYALYDISRAQFFTPMADKPFTKKPRVLDSRKSKLEDQVKHYSKKANWTQYGYSGPAPKLKLVEVPVTI